MSAVEPMEAFAIIEDGRLLVETVAATRRAAAVNWLVTRGHAVFAWDTDEEITKRFVYAGGGMKARLVRALVSVARSSAGAQQPGGDAPDPRDVLLVDIRPVLEGIAETLDVEGEPAVVRPLLERIARELPS